MINKKLIILKLSKIKDYYKEMEPLLKFKPNEILADYYKLRTFEREFQLIVDTILDINTHIISTLDFQIPDDYQGTFAILAQAKVLPEKFCNKFASVVGLRNMIVHKYEKVDNKKFIFDLQKEAKDFKEYCGLIEKYIQKK
ncbi:MAG: DUF86 domain-containing protein [Candidatus Kuenenbacteria bacterium]